ncbi:alpha/beta hydrolase [Enterococcus sp. MJM12]|uniref:Alpha/beta hydrolase n=1 Tax=Candidatus Enterococcus myersii TaxID=2815322 RepID=A0ABS3H8J4_9ENTE|nr:MULTISPECIES: alpha/beta hydrolase [Enterococcus]MBO0449773.1 alpha/beta hydrolase [Enterococcus sp. MJM12]MCD1023770.1 alpha/beta hydrolase [Enterococcus sp. SMC-9]WHA08511.1 alpha/beta hydrolase [Enterococcus montenegrensis]
MANKWLKGVLWLGLLAFLLNTFHVNAKAEDRKVPITLENEALVMVPGTGATVDRFDKLIVQLQKTTACEVLKITVQTNGQLTIKGELSQKASQPIIVIGFADSSEETVPKQAVWYEKAIAYVQHQYGVEHYNFLGHSNGGLVLTDYLEYVSLSIDPKPNKILFLGTPFNDVGWKYNEMTPTFNEVKKVSDVLKRYLDNKQRLPKTISVVSVAGNVADGNSDGTVPVTSLLAGGLIYGDSQSYQTFLVTENAKHSQLVVHPTVMRLIQTFLWSAKK